MNWFTSAAASPHVDRLARVLAHSLWEGLALAVALGLLLRWTSVRRTNLRFGLALTALCGVVAAACVTWSLLSPAVANPHHDGRVIVQDRDRSGVGATDVVRPTNGRPELLSTDAADSTPAVAVEPSTWPAVFVIVWLLGACVMLIRGSCDLIAARRLTAGPECSDTDLRSVLDGLLQRLGLRPDLRIVLTDRLSSPAVWGLWKPVLLLPVALQSSLTVEEAAAVFAHELAHLRRYDQWTIVLQLVIESLLFFNPAVWWISRLVRQEREACCDAFAARLIGSPVDYARVLADHAGRLHSSSTRPLQVPAFADASSGSLLDRVRRLLLPEYRPAIRVSWSQCAVLLCLAGVALFGVHKTADLSVAVAQELLRDEERVQQVVERAEQVKPLAVKPLAFDKVRITGTIEIDPALTTVDRVHVSSQVQRTEQYSTGGTEEAIEGRTFDVTVSAGLSIILAFEHPDSATTFLGPFGPQDGPLIMGQEVRIVPGESRSIRVVDGDGRPAAGVRVSPSSSPDGRHGFGISRSVVTAADGVAAVPHLRRENKYSLSFSGAGYQNLTTQPFDPFGTETPEFRVVRARPSHGIVVDANEQPVAGVKLRRFLDITTGFVNGSGSFDQPLAVTGNDGSFELTALQDGHEYVLLLSHPDYAVAFLSRVEAGQDGLQGRLERGITVRGRIAGWGDDESPPKSVQWSERLPSQGARNQPPTIETWSQSAAIDAEGRFTLEHVNPGELSLRIGNELQRFTVAVETSEIVFTPQPRATVQKREVLVRFTHAGRSVAPQGVLQITGRFTEADGTLPGVGGEFPPIRIEDGVARCRLPVPAKSIHADPKGLLGYWFNSHQVDWPDIEPGTEPLEITVEVRPAVAVTGRILDVDGRPAWDASAGLSFRLEYRAPSGSQISHSDGLHANVDGEGRYFLSPIPLGAECVLSAGAGHYKQVEGELVLSPDIAVIERDIQLGPTADVAGLVVDPEGHSVVAIPVELSFRHPRASTTWQPPAITTADGRFQFNRLNPEGQYVVDLALRSQWQPQRVDLQFGVENRIVLQPGEVVAGTVVDEYGQPVAGVEVHAVTPDYRTPINGKLRFESEARTDAEGRFQFSNLPAARLKLSANEIQGGDIEVDAGTTREVELRGKIAEWFRSRNTP